MSAAGPPLTPEGWGSRYRAEDTPWDLGRPAPGLLSLLDEGVLAPCRVLVPGCGRGHDALLLADRGFDVVALDYAPEAIRLAEDLAATRGESRVRFLVQDFLCFEAAEPFDLLWEHTCFPALHSSLRQGYARAIARLVRPGGILAGVFFVGSSPGGPPFEATTEEIEALLSPAFEKLAWEPARVRGHTRREEWTYVGRRHSSARHSGGCAPRDRGP
ncbi:MAG: methyltransferase domain-containing protein [Planctomycetes bacterium]|nr:methyltransferase domain-containing protein [Planctomycetota bacterium]